MSDTDFDIDALLDSTLDDLEDLPSFKPFPAGCHQVTCSMEKKDLGGHPSIVLDFTLLETLELADPNTPEAEQSKPGDTSNTACMMDNEFGVGNFKKLALPIGAALGVAKLSEVIEQCQDIECVILTSIRTDKNDKDKHYLNVKELNVV